MLLANFIGDNLLAHDTNDVKRILGVSIEQPDIEMVTTRARPSKGSSILNKSRIWQGRRNPFLDSGIDAVNTTRDDKTFPRIYVNQNFG